MKRMKGKFFEEGIERACSTPQRRVESVQQGCVGRKRAAGIVSSHRRVSCWVKREGGIPRVDR